MREKQLTVALISLPFIFAIWLALAGPSTSLRAAGPSPAVTQPNQVPTSSMPAQVVVMSPNSMTNVPLHSCSGVIGSGGVAQNAIAAAPNVHGHLIVNLSNGDTEWISYTGVAAPSSPGSFPLLPLTTTGGGSFVAPFGMGANGNLSIFGATTGDPYSCLWW